MTSLFSKPKIPAVKPVQYTPPPIPEAPPVLEAPIPADARNVLASRRNQMLTASRDGSGSGRSSTILSDRLGG